MEELLTEIDLDPIASPIGLVVVVLGVRLLLGTIKTVLKLLFLGVILVGLYLFFYGGNVA